MVRPLMAHHEHHTAFRLAPLVVVLSLAAASPAWAYLDPGTGSYLFQMALAGLLGAVFSFRLQVRRLVAKLRDRFSPKHE
jgi:hypothetical protein